jgi:hypothetical protein
LTHAARAGVVLCIWACSAGVEVPDGPRAYQVDYHLAWRLDDVTPDPGGGLRLTNDLGHLIHLQTGWLSSTSAQLVPCPSEQQTFELISRAWAGHGDLDDPSLIDDARIEALHAPVAQAWGRVTYAPETDAYCKAHYLVARTERTGDGLPDARFGRQAAYLAGQVTVDGETTPFEWSTDLASGTLGAFDMPRVPGQGITIRIERDLVAVFAGVDLRQPDPVDLVFNLADATQVTVD